MMRRRNMLDRMAERVMDLDSPAYGDERERVVFMEANSFGLTIGLYLGFLGAAVASLFGLVLLPVALLVMAYCPSMVAAWYATRRGVDFKKVVEDATARSATDARSLMITTVTLGATTVLTFAAMAYTVFTGQPVLPTPSLGVTPGEGILGATVRGAIIGAMIGAMLGGLAAIVGSVRDFRRTRRQAPGR